MLVATRIALFSSTAACASGFLSPTPRWQGGITVEIPAALRASAVPAGVGTAQEVKATQAVPASLGALLAGALATGAALLRSRRGRRTTVARRVWDRRPALPNMEVDGDPSRGPDYRTSVNLKRYAKRVGRQRYYKQQQILRESGITCAKGGYKKWYPNRETFNLYKGPESHPDNPWFPHYSAGYKRTEAVHSWAPAQLGATSAPGSTSSTFAGGSSKRHWHRGARAAGSALVLHAHKKTSASTKNQGHSLKPHFWGLTKHGFQGCAVKAGTRLLKQKGMNWYAGKNVARAKDYSLVALRDGIVQWRGNYRHREVTVVPWEYVREKCVWTNPNTLGPKEYEPWMGTHDHNKRHYILDLRRRWLKSEEGREWSKKKEEKKEKQKAIQKKIRVYLKAKRQGKVPAKAESADPVVAGAESESEAEA
uniref:Ribosomal protein L27 n=1 Tax=Alexandrium monilatum TaxID=311494 RepID=A0A7S4W4C2_9DINO